MRLSIRYKMLLVIGAVLLLALGSHLYLATSLFAQDKLAYIYDLNATTAQGLAEQTDSTLRVLAKEARLFAREALRPDVSAAQREALLRELFANDAEIVRVQVFKQDTTTPLETFTHKAALELLGLTKSDLDFLRQQAPLPLASLRAEPAMTFLQNSSLPPDTALATLTCAAGELVVAVDFRPERLLQLFGEKAIRQAMLVDERGMVIAHPDAKQVVERRNVADQALVRTAITSKAVQGAQAFDSQGAEWLGAYARVELGRLTVLTQVPRAEALRASDELVRRSLLFAIAILLAAFVASLLLSRLVTAPIWRLRSAAENLGVGKFDVTVDVTSQDEIGDLARSFERMTHELKETQRQLVQSEKLAAFGQLGAGITHEVKNPITALVGFAQLAQRKLDDKQKLSELLKIIEQEGLRCRDLLSNFLMFTRTSGAAWEDVSATALVEQAARLLRHQLAIHNVQLVLELAPDAPVVSGNAAELSQVLLNLGMNAQQAMANGGVVTVRTFVDDEGQAVIAVSDTGPGIPDDIKDRIFEPFFTTKKPGEGTGLGLSISFSIVRAHKGTLSVTSKPGEGATFSIRLPMVGVAERPATKKLAANS